MSMDWVLYASLSETRLAVAFGKASGEPSSSLSNIWIEVSRLSIRTKFTSMITLYTYIVRNVCRLPDAAPKGRNRCELRRAV